MTAATRENSLCLPIGCLSRRSIAVAYGGILAILEGR